jgi:hypothetical protein
MPDPVKKKKTKKPIKPGGGGGVTKPKGRLSKKRPTQTGYGPQNRPGTFPKKKKKKGPKLKGGGKVLTSGSAKSVAALRKAALLKAKKKGVKKPMKPVVKAKRGSSRTKRKTLAQLKKEGKINF